MALLQFTYHLTTNNHLYQVSKIFDNTLYVYDLSESPTWRRTEFGLRNVFIKASYKLTGARLARNFLTAFRHDKRLEGWEAFIVTDKGKKTRLDKHIEAF